MMDDNSEIIVDMSAALPIMQQYSEDMNNACIAIQRSPEFIQKAKAVSDYLEALHIPNAQHNELVRLLVDHVQEAERNAFMQGCSLGVNLGMELATDQEPPADQKPDTGGKR